MWSYTESRWRWVSAADWSILNVKIYLFIYCVKQEDLVCWLKYLLFKIKCININYSSLFVIAVPRYVIKKHVFTIWYSAVDIGNWLVMVRVHHNNFYRSKCLCGFINRRKNGRLVVWIELNMVGTCAPESSHKQQDCCPISTCWCADGNTDSGGCRMKHESDAVWQDDRCTGACALR